MKWWLKVRDNFSFLSMELKKYSDSWLLILFATLIVAIVVYIILVSLSKTSIFPKDTERYDVNTLYLGQMKELCPKEFATNPGKKEFEACASKINIENMIEAKIPTFNETIKSAPNLPYLLEHSTDPNLRKASSFFKKGNYFIIGIKVPEKFFSVDGNYIKNGDINESVADYYVLTFKAIRFGFTCVGSSCDNMLGLWTENVIQIPLIRDGVNKSNLIWVFGLENSSPHGIWLDDGIMITKSANLYSTHLFYSLFKYGKSMFASIAFVALFLVSISFAIYLRRFFDYPAFSYFTGSTALWFVSMNLFVLFPWLKGFTYRLLNIWIILNFLLSILILNLAYARFKSVLKRKYFFISHVVILCLIVFAKLYFKDLGALVSVWSRLQLIFSNTATVFAIMPLAYGIYELLQLLKKSKDVRPSTHLDYRRRIKELSIYAIVWVVFCFNYTYFAFIGLGTGNIGVFFSTSIGLTLLLLGVMLYYTHSKEITHMSSDAFAELERLYRRKTTREFHEIVKEPFEGVLFVIDLANSSGKDDRLKRKLMENLLDLCNKEANNLGYYVNFAKPAGDDWKLIFMKKNSSIGQDLFEITKLAVVNQGKIEKCIKDVFEDSSVHISIFALSQYVIYINENQESEYGYRTMLDFSSSEADLMLKYIDKSKVQNTIMVGGKRLLFSEELKNMMLKKEVCNLENLVADKSKNIAKELDIVYGLAVY